MAAPNDYTKTATACSKTQYISLPERLC